MWKTTFLAFKHVLTSEVPMLAQESCMRQQIRSTYILKRKFAPQLKKKGCSQKPLRSRHYIYELIKDTTVDRHPEIDVILTSYVDGLGNAGEKVSVKSNFAYNNLLLPGLAIYASPENVEKFKDQISESDKGIKYSSPNALLTIRTLSRMVLSVVMNKDHPWTIQPWHIKASFRKCGYVVPEDAITLPEKPIKGPDMGIEDKEFFITVVINNAEKVNVRCRLHHWSTEINERIPRSENFWEKSVEPVYPELEEVLSKIPKKGTQVNVKKLEI